MHATQNRGDRRTTEDDLDRLRELKRRAVDLAASHLRALDLFSLARDTAPLPSLADGPSPVVGFTSSVPTAADPDDRPPRVSLASTAACVRSVLLSPEVKPGRPCFDDLVTGVVERHRNGQVSTSGLEHLNPFTVGQLLPTLAEIVPPEPGGPLDPFVADGTARLEAELASDGVSLPMASEPGAEPRFLAHGYLTYWALVAVDAWDRLDVEAAMPSLRWSETELYRQIALFEAGHDERSDAYQLGYNLLIQHRFNRVRLGDSLVELGLRTLFGAQLERGVWEKRDPVFRYGEHGEAYCFSFDLLSSLLRELRDGWALLVPCEEHLARALEWASRNALRQHGPPLWRAAHLIENSRPESWATAVVYSFLQQYVAYLSWRIQTIVADQFRSFPGCDPNPAAFDHLYQPEVSTADGDSSLLGDFLRERILEPLRVPGPEPVYSLVRSIDPNSKARSGILYGPPGTGKTTYVRQVAAYLGWPLVVLDPSVFAAEGLPLIATVAAEVFAQLLELEDTVIFFDEMEALMHTRADAGGSFEQKFLTTSLLPKLQELADEAACLFFVATNHFSTIDPAAQRPGRFDFRLQILPPSYDEKLRMARDRLGPDTFAAVETDLRREPYREHLRLASRSETVALCNELAGRPRDAEQILSRFRAELTDDDSFVEDGAVVLS